MATHHRTLTQLFADLTTKLRGLLPNAALVNNPHTLNPGQSDMGNTNADFLADAQGMPTKNRNFAMLTGTVKSPFGLNLGADLLHTPDAPGTIVDLGGDNGMVALSDRLFHSGTVVPPSPDTLPGTQAAVHAAPMFDYT